MKFLLVGFSPKATVQFEQLIYQELGEHIVHNVPREFVDLNPIIPQISARETQSDLCVIDLDGIGMWEYSPDHKSEIVRILANRPAILISYQIHSGWQDAVTEWTLSKIDLVAKPHTTEDMINLLLLALRRELKRKPQQSVYTSAQSGNHVPEVHEPKQHTEKASIYASKAPVSSVQVDEQTSSRPKKESIYATKTAQAVHQPQMVKPTDQQKKSIYAAQDKTETHENIGLVQNILEQAQFARKLLSKHWYDFEHNELYRHLFDLFAQKDTFKIQWNHHELVVYPQRNALLVRDFAQFWADFQQLNEQQLQNLFFNKIPVNGNYEQLETIYLQQFYIRYPLNVFLWQFYHYVLPSQFTFNEYELKLKLKALPKFAQMEKMPAYMQNVATVCVEKTQNLEQLQQSSRFNFLNLSHMQRIFLLSVLADYADSHLLLNTLTEKKVVAELAVEEEKIETAVVEAKDKGLLQRLFGKR